MRSGYLGWGDTGLFIFVEMRGAPKNGAHLVSGFSHESKSRGSRSEWADIGVEGHASMVPMSRTWEGSGHRNVLGRYTALCSGRG